MNMPKPKQDLTNSESVIYEFINNKINMIPFMTVEYIAKSTFTSVSCVIRLSKKLGFTGYKDFLRTICKNLNEASKDNSDIISDIDKLLFRIQDVNSKYDYKKAAKLIRSAGKVLVYGHNKNIAIVDILNAELNSKNITAITTQRSITGKMIVNNFQQNDCIIFISDNYDSNKFNSIIKMAVNRGVKSIAITSEKANKLINQVDVALCFPYISSNYKKHTTLDRINKIIVLDTIMENI